MAKFESKYTVLTKKIDNIMYELFVKTHSDMVYVNDTTTLTETLVKLSDLLTDSKKTEAELWEEYNKLTNGAPDRFNTFKEVWDYVNVNGDPKSELIQLIEKKQNAEEGKGLSTHDFTDLLYDKLKNDYTASQLDEKFRIIIKDQNAIKDTIEENQKATQKQIEEIKSAPNIFVGTEEESENVVKNGDIWYEIIQN